MKHYFSNIHFEAMDTTEEGCILFNPANGEVHMLDFIGNTIYSLLQNPLTLDALLDQLCRIFDAPRDVITSDVLAFLQDAAAKEIILTDEH